jgi:hypothetical protein
MTRVKLAELTSGIGALVLGVGLGALFADWFASSATAIVLVGVAAHAFGMWDKHQLERQSTLRSRGGLPACAGAAGCSWQLSSCS